VRFIRVKVALIAPFFVLLTYTAEPDNGLVEYKAANYKVAIPLLETAARTNIKDPVTSAALLSALVYEGRVEEASDAAEADSAQFPTSPDVIAGRGEFAFYMGDMQKAEGLFKAAMKLKQDTPRAVYGLSRLCRLAFMYRTARLLCLKAHEIDPDDALITRSWLRYVSEEKRKELLGPFAAAHPWLYKNFEPHEQTSSEIKDELNGRKPFELAGPRTETMLPLASLRRDAMHVRGVGLELGIEGGKRMNLLFDTGATGILVPQAAVDRAGLKHLGSFQGGGVGDKGAKNAFGAVADNCAIGALKYRTCVFYALEGKGRVAGEDDGLIGADFFSDYLIQIDW
jgi:tetratricopeptide (TPR) repeat protein